jgi:hypothetical protein
MKCDILDANEMGWTRELRKREASHRKWTKIKD